MIEGGSNAEHIKKLNAEIEKTAAFERRINNDVVLQIARKAEFMMTARENVAKDLALFASSVVRAERQAAEMIGAVVDKMAPALHQIEEMQRIARQYRPLDFNASEFTSSPMVVTSPGLLELQRQQELQSRSSTFSTMMPRGVTCRATS